MPQLVALSLAAFSLSYIGVIGVKRWAERWEIFDVPNQRSSHSRPTPRGGGLAVVIVVMSGLAVYGLVESMGPWQNVLVCGVGVSLVSIVSWLDDLRTLPNSIRFAAHSLGAVLAIVGFGYWNGLSLPLFGQLQLGYLGLPVTFLWIVGLTNAYNFMDGIDGIAGAQAVVAGFGWLLLGYFEGMPLARVWGALLAASSLGFLFHNWPPARIFMGDIGSAFLGYSFACLAIVGCQKNSALALAGILLVWPFVFDTTFTFFRRLINRENVLSAHRSHLYQRLVISGLSHQMVTVLYAGLALLGVVLALLVVKKEPGVDRIVLTVSLLGCIGLWGLTVIRENVCQKASIQDGRH
jgi:UDP-N-acetylmuramyl pentapeptide phosphotransferase/UDP-N-acetylglucosamine-1-phosphate transferase